MRVLSALVAVVSLALTIAAFPIIGAGVLFALFLFFPAFMLGLVALLATLDDRTVPHHAPAMNPTGWRDSSAAVDARGPAEHTPRPEQRLAA
jgi:hypothetical protein